MLNLRGQRYKISSVYVERRSRKWELLYREDAMGVCAEWEGEVAFCREADGGGCWARARMGGIGAM